MLKNKTTVKILICATALLLALYFFPRYTQYYVPLNIKTTTKQLNKQNIKINTIATQLLPYCKKNNLSNTICFIIDMSLHSGKNRFFVYNYNTKSITNKNLVAHGSCNNLYLEKAKFANIVNSGCSSLGKYKISHSYKGQFGKAYKLIGLDTTNNKAFERFVVLHAYSCVPNKETYPQPICNSLGCPMVSYNFLTTLAPIIDSSKSPIMLYITN